MLIYRPWCPTSTERVDEAATKLEVRSYRDMRAIHVDDALRHAFLMRSYEKKKLLYAIKINYYEQSRS